MIKQFLVLDVSNINKIRLIRYLDIPARYGSIIHEGSIERHGGNDFIYMACYTDGCLVYDITGNNASDPKMIAFNSGAVKTINDKESLTITQAAIGGTTGFWGSHPLHGQHNYSVSSSFGSRYYNQGSTQRSGTITNETINPDDATVLYFLDN